MTTFINDTKATADDLNYFNQKVKAGKINAENCTVAECGGIRYIWTDQATELDLAAWGGL